MLNSLLELLLPAGAKRRARRLLTEGEVVAGVIDAVRVVERSESADQWFYGVSVGERRYGMRQWLEPERGRAQPGLDVVLRVSGDEALIDWPATLER